MKVCVLSSGSKGNMTYIEAGKTKLLIDAGISLTSAIKRSGINELKEATDIIITHEHGDHIGFLDTIYKKTKANIYMSKKSYLGLKSFVKDNLLGVQLGFIEPEGKYKIGDVYVYTFKLNHDCMEVLGYIVCYEGKMVGYFTDTGIMPEKYKKYLSKLDMLIIEANHNIEMLINSDRDYTLKNRILSSQGHLSNDTCYEILKEVLQKENKLKTIVLAHVSEDCNSDSCIYNDVISKLHFEGKILIARQREALEVINL